ncbi:WhiB family transcriptional regulator [Geodermatophilus sp. SYSU D00691]
MSYSSPYLSLVPEPADARTDTWSEAYAEDVYAVECAVDGYPNDEWAPAPATLPYEAPAQADAADGDETWRLDALCAETDPEAFFPEKGGSTREAKRVCAGCPVRLQCLEFALGNDERFGIWGGLSERERRRIRLQRRGMPLSA